MQIHNESRWIVLDCKKRKQCCLSSCHWFADVRAFMLFTSGSRISRINFDATDLNTLYSGNTNWRFTACDFDFKTSKVFFAALDLQASPFIGQVLITGGAPTKIVTSGIGFVQNLEVDYLHQKIFWIDSR